MSIPARRLPDGRRAAEAQPCDYWRNPLTVDNLCQYTPGEYRVTWVWMVCDPSGTVHAINDMVFNNYKDDTLTIGPIRGTKYWFARSQWAGVGL